MHPHSTEVVSESGLEKSTRLSIQWLPRRSQNVIDNRWNFADVAIGTRLSLQYISIVVFSALVA
jgi:hypothetical protein